MFAARLAAALLATLLLASSSHAASKSSASTKPQGLHAFLLRSDEPLSRTFARTPAFAWAPLAGATKYEFQLSTSSAFRDSGIIYSDKTLTSPVASVDITLPWITGKPYSLYARVRGVLQKTTTPWSAPFGFNMKPADVPSPLPSYPGLLRWTPVEGATAYQVWLVDVPKYVGVYTNVLDEREFYTFHQSPSWTSSVRWRIRAVRDEQGGRANGLPAVTYGPWSPIYESVNPPFAVGPLNGLATVSDVIATGDASDAHRLMPAFVFTGSKSFDDSVAELYRVYAFTDRDCINRVFASAIIGSPAYAPRPGGPLSLPRDTGALALARGMYASDGNEGNSFAYDDEPITANESLPEPTPTTGLPAGASSGTAPAPATGTGSAGDPAPGTGSINLIKVTGKVGAPVDLWDTNWPEGGYYWTVVPVAAKAPDSMSTSVGEGGAALGSGTLPVANSAGFSTGDVLEVGNPFNQETVAVTTISGNTLTLATTLKFAHGTGEPVIRTSGNLVYRDLELPQETCAAGRVMRFGKSSEPTLTTAGAPFASGLSGGRLVSASSASPKFYGAPLVAWSPALGASVYEVQWSKVRYPFQPETNEKTGAIGDLTMGTSTVLPLKPGTWYYRVRGIDWSLPTGAQAMSWSDPAKVVVTKPTFKVVSKKKKK